MNESIVSDDALWFKDAIIYQAHVKSFFDANNDGIGDFRGLASKLDYIADLGVTAIWLLPFYPSPRRDDGYDIAEYCNVSPDYGSLEDAARFIEEAHSRGIRVITELVINHTSNEHPWFKAARSAAPGSPERDFYVWSDNDRLYAGTRIIFLDTEKSNWTWDEEAKAYYWHRFYSHQPDLNFDNPAVLREVLRIMHFWLDLGVDGLRLDAVPYLIERDGTSNENLPETHTILKQIRADLDAHYSDKMLLAEANMWPEDTQQYFGEHGDECHMAFHFPLMPRMYMAIAQEDRFPITDIMRQTPEIPPNCQWAIFLRNHDELTLEMVTDSERDYLWNTYAADNRARLNLGIRRRLAPLMERDRRRIELMNALLLSMPGTPVLYYGDEIAMGDNIHIGDRDGVRTPMQWSPDRNGGFSRCDPARLTLPVIMDPVYGYEAVNVEAQTSDSHSLLNWVKRMLAVRKEFKAFGRGSQRFLRPANRKILTYLREYEDEHILCVANVARTAQAVELDLSEFSGRTPLELTGRTPFPAIGQLPYLLTLPPYGFYWFRLSEDVSPPNWSAGMPGSGAEHHTFVLRNGIADILWPRERAILESDILPAYVRDRRWFQGKNTDLRTVRVAEAIPLPNNTELLFTDIEVTTDSDQVRYALPLGIAWENRASGPFAPNLALARVRLGRHVGLLTDGFSTPAFARDVMRRLRNSDRLSGDSGEWRFVCYRDFDLPEDSELEWPAAEQTNSSMIIGRRAVLKLLRKIQPGIHPEAEMTRVLGERGFQNTAPLFGEVIRVDPSGVPHTMILLQGYLENQGDGWNWTLNFLRRFIDDYGEGNVAEPLSTLENYRTFAATLGQRLAGMHDVLAQPDEDPAFRPEEVSKADMAEWASRVGRQVEIALEILARQQGMQQDEETVERLIAGRPVLDERISALASHGLGTLRTRIHGDLHLGQVLVMGGDVAIIDFEGEPTRSLEERRAKDSPARDIAGVIRSFDYAAASVVRSGAFDPATHPGAKGVAELFPAIATDAFLRGYAEVHGEWPAPLIDLFLIEKASYEIAYEAANRPDWIGIPLHGLANIIRRLLEDAGP